MLIILSKIGNITRFAAIKNPVVAPSYLYHRSLMIDLHYVNCSNDKDLQKDYKTEEPKFSLSDFS